MTTRFARPACLVMFVFLCSMVALGQTSGRLVGVVTDQTGALVPNAEVVVRPTAEGEERRFATARRSAARCAPSETRWARPSGA